MTTVEVLCRAVTPGTFSECRLQDRPTASAHAGYLRKYPLLHPRLYFVLGESAANVLRHSAGIAPRRWDRNRSPWEYAILVYATLGKKPRQRLTATELLQKFCPGSSPALADAPHCEEQSQGVLGTGPSRPGRPRRSRRPQVQPPTSANAAGCVNSPPSSPEAAFRLVVITATKEKAVAVQQALDRHEWPDGLLIHFSVIPQLLSLTASRNHA